MSLSSEDREFLDKFKMFTVFELSPHDQKGVVVGIEDRGIVTTLLNGSHKKMFEWEQLLRNKKYFKNFRELYQQSHLRVQYGETK